MLFGIGRQTILQFDLLLIYALEGSFRPSCIILRCAPLSPSISSFVYQYYSRFIVRRPEIETGIAEQSSLV